MACGACARRRKRMEDEKRRRESRGEKLVPAAIGATLAVIEAVAKPLKKKDDKQ
jgi:hypothetical protein